MAEKAGVVVGMSGGVDSSVAAALLLEQGYRVFGVMVKVWRFGSGQPSDTGEDTLVHNAKRVAEQLGIPLTVIDAEKAFLREVVQPFISGYLEGITPSPCPGCNRRLKGKILLHIAEQQGLQFAATGHYARVQTNPETGKRELLKGIDSKKDQSYMLALMDHKDLERFIFPLGGLLKSDVRKIASKMGLMTAERRDSQDLCFLPEGNYREFLKRYAGRVIKPGEIVSTSGKVLGEHEGLPFYTIGQRKGIRVAAPQPLYVLRKDIQTNRLVVGELEELGYRQLVAREVNWISGEIPTEAFRAEIKVRYQSTSKWGLVIPNQNGSATIQFDERLRDITPGQVTVFYAGEKLLGGGVIDLARD